MNKFVAIEGLDSSGKSTQINLLKKYLDLKGIKYRYLHFPRTDSHPYGKMIASFLRGEFGNVNSVNPYLVALLYAGDREDAKFIIEDWLSQKYLVIVDRYVLSNIAFQCAKVNTLDDKEELRKWIIELEYGYNKVPSPSLSIFLHVPFEFIVSKLVDRRDGGDRTYLKGKEDIHESSIDLQKKVEAEYLRLVNSSEDLYVVNCSTRDNEMLSTQKVSSEIIELLTSKGVA